MLKFMCKQIDRLFLPMLSRAPTLAAVLDCGQHFRRSHVTRKSYNCLAPLYLTASRAGCGEMLSRARLASCSWHF